MAIVVEFTVTHSCSNCAIPQPLMECTAVPALRVCMRTPSVIALPTQGVVKLEVDVLAPIMMEMAGLLSTLINKSSSDCPVQVEIGTNNITNIAN